MELNHDNNIISLLEKEFRIKGMYIKNIMELIDGGSTIPFIARYRKEAHGALDDQIIRSVVEKFEYLRNLYGRKDEVKRLIDEQGKLTEEISKAIENAETVTEIEDIYRPFRPKKRTRATIAKEKGLEPFAETIIKGECDIEEVAKNYLNDKVETIEDAINGAKDIIAEIVSDNADYRKYIRELTYKKGTLISKKATDEKTVYEMYYDFSEAVNKIANHRVLAVNRGEKEKILNVKIEPPIEEIVLYLKKSFITGKTNSYIEEAIEDGYKRLINSSIETEIRNILTDRAEEASIDVFKDNLKQLLMQSPVKDKIILSIDPGYRMGCKVAVIDEKGDVLATDVIYITKPREDIEGGKRVLRQLIAAYNVNLIAIGNGTASEETEIFVSDFLKEIDKKIFYLIVNEAGASVYSASELAAKEYPELDVNLRSAVALAQRVQDPLAQFVKVEPKAIGVGQYQHDMNQKKLSEALNGTVEDCVNSVGVDLNTASTALLNYVSGINKQVAQNIVDYRRENGRFKTRKEILKVAKLGPKAFEQCAGFLRIDDGTNVLDNTAVHPENYDVTKKLLEKLEFNLDDLRDRRITGIEDKINEGLAEELNVGYYTLKDIVKELLKPGRDPREDFSRPVLRSGIMNINDLKVGMIIDGVVKNVVDFGAFVDIVGVHADGLVHVSQLSNKFVRNPLEVVSVGQNVKAKVVSVDIASKRIGLSIKEVEN